MGRRGPSDRRTPARRATALLGLALVSAAAACGPEMDIPDEAHEPGPRIRALLEGGEAPVLPFPSGDTVRFGKDVVEFYRGRDFAPGWTDREGFLPRGERLVTALRGAEREGLDPGAYHAGLIEELIDRAMRNHEEGMAVGDALGNLDILMSDAFLRYTTDLRRGTANPEEAGLEWRIDREDPTDAASLNAIVESDDLEAALDSVLPAVPFYGRLRSALQRYRDIREAGGWPNVPEGETLEEGAVDPRVRALRRRIVAEGNEEEAGQARAGQRPDSFDADLTRAVEHFQRRHGIDVDGRVGGSTLQELNVSVEQRIDALELNLDRWRWLPRELGPRYVLVNVAGFEAAIIRNGRPEFTTDVVVGQEGWETPLFRDTLEYIVVNPYWNVPESIKEEEILPAVRQDPGYLARNHYQVVDGNGDVVDPGRVDLASDAYRVRQLPGRDNALGDVKFLFPNDHDIYLHDTPADHLFARTGRAFSHGCIRVAKPIELAHYLFRTSTSRGAEEFDRLRAAGEEEWVELEDKLPVYILYFTAWADADGTVHFYRDVYGRDRRIERLAAGSLAGAGSGTPVPPAPAPHGTQPHR